jgi:hypothetical protein
MATWLHSRHTLTSNCQAATSLVDTAQVFVDVSNVEGNAHQGICSA